MEQGDHVFLVDGSGYIFRAYHALPPLTRKSDGLPCGAVSGFCNMLWKLICGVRDGWENGSPQRNDGRAKADKDLIAPTHFAVIFDYSSETFRKEIYPEYKANRPAPPEDLVPQFGLIRQATRAFNLPCIEQEGYEADDIIATYARMAEAAGADVTIISSDKDLMQLVNQQVRLYDSMKDKATGIAEVEAKWGVPPSMMVDFQALVGDSVDNVPGVSGIGPKTAADLLHQFGSLDGILRHAAEIPQKKRRETLIEQADRARLSRRLVELCSDVPVEESLNDLKLLPPDGVKLIRFLKAMEFNSLTRRVAQALDVEASAVDPDRLEIDWQRRGAAGAEAGIAAVESIKAKGNPEQPADLFGEENNNSGADLLSAYDNPAASPQILAAYKMEQAKQSKFDRNLYKCLTDPAELAAWLEEAGNQGYMAFDTETNSLNPLNARLIGFSIALAPNKAAYVPLMHKAGQADLLGDAPAQAGQMDKAAALKLLKPVLEDEAVLKIGQNIKYDIQVMAGQGVNLQCVDDTMLLSYVLQAGAVQSHGMDALAKQWLNHDTIHYSDVTGTGRNALPFEQVPLDKATEYAAEDADVTLRLWDVLKIQALSRRLIALYEVEERALIPVLARMERRGILVDKAILTRLSAQFGADADKRAQEIYILAEEEFNIGSPKQLGDILFGKFALPGGKKTKTGQWSTAAQTLDDLAAHAQGDNTARDGWEGGRAKNIVEWEAELEQDETEAEENASELNEDSAREAANSNPSQAKGYALAGKIVAWRQLKKLQSTYTDALPNFQDKEGRVHTTYSLAATTTGRLASSEPNLQNIPVRTTEGRLIRAAFIAPEGKLLLSADYSQIELRVLAHVADIAALKKAFAQGIDIHAMTASEMFDVPLDRMTPEIRRRAKAINFGIIYGISPFGLANQLGISRDEAAQYIHTYFERFPGIKTYMEQAKTFAREHGYVETIFGRRIYYPQIKASNPQIRAFNERAAINAPIQGAAADIIRRAMVKMESGLAEKGLSAQMLLQVHDELIFEVAADEAEETMKVVKAIMEDAAFPAVILSVPLKVDAHCAKNWNDAH